jgi:hypothetical protein
MGAAYVSLHQSSLEIDDILERIEILQEGRVKVH